MHLKLISWLLLFLIFVVFILFISLNGNEYLNFSTLKDHHLLFQTWIKDHYFLTALAYIVFYIFMTVCSIPGALFITVAGGYLFGPLAILYVLASATLGATIIFLIVRYALGAWVENKIRHWLPKFKKDLQNNAFNYLLFLRLIPIFPFWVVNIAAGVFAIPGKTFVVTTFLGIIPATVIYVMLGNSFRELLKMNQGPSLMIIFSPFILLPLIGLALLVLLPVIYKKWKSR